MNYQFYNTIKETQARLGDGKDSLKQQP